MSSVHECIVTGVGCCCGHQAEELTVFARCFASYRVALVAYEHTLCTYRMHIEDAQCGMDCAKAM